MKRKKIRSTKSPEQLLLAISDNNFVSEGVKFNDKGTKPHMHVKDRGDGKIKIRCEIMGGPSKDNGFLEGTSFRGRIKKVGEGSEISGIILTAPIFHLVLIALVAVIIVQCIYLKAINVIPIFAVLFDLILFRSEFKKQGYIERYLHRAVSRLEKRG